jgi:mono/diheme cytochrome c family protein
MPLWTTLLLAASAVAADPAAVDKPSSDNIAPTDPAAIEFFEAQVRPLLEARCYKCHGGGEAAKGGLRLNARASLLRGGDTGAAISLEAPAESLLLKAINYDGYEMPPEGKLPPEEIAILARWVELGLPWTPGEEGDESELPAAHGPPQVNDEARNFWSFRPVERPAVPAATDPAWNQNPIDAFILSRLESEGLRPAPAASRQALIRRAYYDLTGLPPTPEEVAAFVADESADAWPRLVERLLESPHYGEKWGRHWLDLVRYAETNSYERDGIKPNAWRYRDYVIRAFNQDLPYDRFVTEQLAGDELPDRTADTLIATGYYRLGIWDDEPVDHEQALYDDLDDILATTSQVFLGLTMNCARCHDHKLDPVPQADYYRMLSFFAGVQRFGVRSYESIVEQSLRTIAPPEEQQRHAAAIAAHQAQIAENDKALAIAEEAIRADLSPVEKEEFEHEDRQVAIAQKRVPGVLSEEQFAEYKRLHRRRDKLRRSPPAALEMALCVTEIGPTPRDMHVLVRGNPHVPGDRVEPGFPSVLPTATPEYSSSDHGTCGRRLALARWIASSGTPLTARVMVNRVWQHHFGEGLVRTPSNFGLQGDAPTHPELLDWLAAEFVARGWRIKELHRLMMLSQTYQRSSQADAAALERDPENRLLARFNMRRLTAEEVRDSILAVNGTLNRDKMFGPSIYTIIPDEVLAGQSMPGAGWGRSAPDDEARRSIYIHVKRSLPPPILASFDAPDTDFSCPVRFATTQPTQALGLMNSAFLNTEARRFVETLRRQAPDDRAEQVRLCLRRVTQREVTEDELARGLRLIEALESEHGLDADRALTLFCVVALNLNEFMYLD